MADGNAALRLHAAGILCRWGNCTAGPVLGVYLMLRRQALMADMLSHVSLAGVAAGAYLGINPTITGFIVAVIGAIIVEYVRRSYKTYSEISVAIIMVGGLSTAVILMNLNQSINKGFSAYLFGSVVAVNQTELMLMIVVAVIGGIFFSCFGALCIRLLLMKKRRRPMVFLSSPSHLHLVF